MLWSMLRVYEISQLLYDIANAWSIDFWSYSGGTHVQLEGSRAQVYDGNWSFDYELVIHLCFPIGSPADCICSGFVLWIYTDHYATGKCRDQLCYRLCS